MTTRIDASTVPACERSEWWRQAICDSFVPMNVEPLSKDLRGRVACSAVGDVQFRRIRASAHRFDRSPATIRRSAEDYYKVALGIGGASLLVQDGRETVLRRGELALYDSTRPYTFVMDDDYELAVCLLPKRLLRSSARELGAVTARTIDGRRGVGALVAPLISEMVRHADEVRSGEQDQVMAAVADLVTALVHAEDPSPVPDDLHLARAQAYIRHHLQDPGLAPDEVAGAASISASLLYKVFARAGTTPARYIKECRLQHCWEDLRQPRFTHLTVSAVGARWGMPDPALFSRTFSARFGLTAREHRRGAPRSDRPPAPPAITAATRTGQAAAIPPAPPAVT